MRVTYEQHASKIPMARPNEPDMPPKRTKKVQLGTYRTQIQPKISVTVIKSARCYTEWTTRKENNTSQR